MTKGDLRKELKEATNECDSYDEMIGAIVKYIAQNFKVKKRGANDD